jgi:hypothetical protein
MISLQTHNKTPSELKFGNLKFALWTTFDYRPIGFLAKLTFDYQMAMAIQFPVQSMYD